MSHNIPFTTINIPSPEALTCAYDPCNCCVPCYERGVITNTAVINYLIILPKSVNHYL